MFPKRRMITFVSCMLLLVILFVWVSTYESSNQTAAAEAEQRYVIEVLVPDQIVMVRINDDGNPVRSHQFPAIIAEGVKDVSQHYNIQDITAISSTESGGSVATRTMALMLLVEPKEEE